VRKLRFAAIPLLGLVGGLLVAAAPPSYAAGETWKVVSINNTGCGTSQNQFTVEWAGLGAGAYSNHTVVRSGGLVYMNEDVGTQPNGQESWSLYSSFTYGAVPNPGTWPLPDDQRVWVDFRLEQPKGTVIYSWTVVFESCNSGTVLYNGPTAADKDHDFIPTPQDRCPTLREPDRANGCPLVDRTLSIAYVKSASKFIGFLTAPGHRKLQSHLTVTVFKVRPGADKKIGKDVTNRRGKYVVHKDAQRGRYYAKTPAILIPKAGQAKAETSPKVRVR
jgi:hypothetical protein